MTNLALLEKYSLAMNSIPALQDATYNKSFEVNDKLFYIEDDVWDFRFIAGLHKPYYYVFNFDTISDPEVKLVTKLWVMNEILGNNIKLTTLHGRLNIVKNFISYMGNDFSALMPTIDDFSSYFNSKNTKYTTEYSRRKILKDYFIFIEHVLNIPQNFYAVDYLGQIDMKLKKHTQVASKRKPIEDNYYQNLLSLCKKVMRGSAFEDNYRILSAIILFLSQTGIRMSELFSIQNEPICKETKVNANNIAVCNEYVWARSIKNKSVEDSGSEPIKIPLSKLAKEAYLFLQSFCEPFRKGNQLIGFDGYVFTNSSITRLFRCFLIDFHEELDCFDTMEKYPNLYCKKISDFISDDTFRGREYLEKYGNNYLVYPVFHQFRHTYINLLHRNGFTLPQIYRLANHSSINTTIQHYCEPNIGVSNKSRGEVSFLYKGKIVNNPTSLMTKEIIKFAKEYGISYEGVIQDETQDNY